MLEVEPTEAGDTRPFTFPCTCCQEYPRLSVQAQPRVRLFAPHNTESCACVFEGTPVTLRGHVSRHTCIPTILPSWIPQFSQHLFLLGSLAMLPGPPFPLLLLVFFLHVQAHEQQGIPFQHRPRVFACPHLPGCLSFTSFLCT